MTSSMAFTGFATIITVLVFGAIYIIREIITKEKK